MNAMEAEHVIEGLVPLNVADVGSAKWAAQDQAAQRLNLQVRGPVCVCVVILAPVRSRARGGRTAGCAVLCCVRAGGCVRAAVGPAACSQHATSTGGHATVASSTHAGSPCSAALACSLQRARHGMPTAAAHSRCRHGRVHCCACTATQQLQCRPAACTCTPTARPAPTLATLQAHYNAQQHADEFVVELLVSLDKMKVLVHNLLAIEVRAQGRGGAGTPCSMR